MPSRLKQASREGIVLQRPNIVKNSPIYARELFNDLQGSMPMHEPVNCRQGSLSDEKSPQKSPIINR